MAQLVEHPTLGFGSSYVLRVVGWSPASGSALRIMLRILSLFLPLPLPVPLSLYPLLKNEKRKKKQTLNYRELMVTKGEGGWGMGEIAMNTG